MKSVLSIGIPLAAALTTTSAHENGRPHNHPHGHEPLFRTHPHTHIMFHHVENACRADVEKLCDTPKAVPESTGDPFFDWIFIPGSSPPPEVQDFTMMMDRLFDPLFAEPFGHEQFTLFFVEEPHEAPHFLVDSAAARAAKEHEPEEIPQLVTDLQNYGNEVLTRFDGDSFQYKMARRLTEVDAKSIQHQVHLPFGCAKNHCLRKAAEMGMLSRNCLASIKELESTFALEEELEHRQNLFVGMMWVYIMTLSILLIALARKFHSQRRKRQLRRRILQAVYSNPDTKRQVEGDLGHSLGFVPPLNLHAVRRIGKVGKSSAAWLRCMRRTIKLIFVLLLALVIFYPLAVLPLCIMILILRQAEVCFMNAKAVDGECQCCCCGTSTLDVNSGNLTKEQECCKGTGVCAPSCASCCGGEGCCCGDPCCNGDCSCCATKMKTGDCTCCCCGANALDAEAGNLSKEQECCSCCKGTGVCTPSCASCCGGNCTGGMSGDDCSCCCCGASVADARVGNLSKEQECCNCCKGTGTCLDACASCCGNGGCCKCCCCGATMAQARAGLLTDEQACCCCCKGTGECSCCGPPEVWVAKGRGQKHVVKARKGVYCGVPLEVV